MLQPGARRCTKCGALTASAKKMLIAVSLAAIVVVASITAYTFYPREDYTVLPSVVEFAPSGYGASISCQVTVTFNRPMDHASVESSFQIAPAVTGSFAWSGITMTFTPSAPLADQTYYTVTIGQYARDTAGSPLDCSVFAWSFITGYPPTVRRDVGTGVDDFWIVYPPTHPSGGSPVQHPQWALSAVESGVVMILDRSEGCLPCTQQTSICEAVYSSYPGIHYLYLTSGANEPDASEAFAAYDPSGAVHYVPLTVVLTKVQSPSGGTAIGWHSWEGVIDQGSLSGWIADAISHWNEN